MCFLTQAQVNLDSLWGVWNDDAAPDSNRVQAMHNISWKGYLYSQPDSAYYFAQKLYDFARSKGFKKEMSMALMTQGASYYVRSNYPKAMEYYKKCFELSEEISDKKGMAKTLNNIGVIYSNQGNYPKALEYYQRSLKIKEEISDKSGMAGAMNNIGLIYMNQGDYPHALDYFQKSLKIKEEVSDKRGIAQIMNNIGLIYMKQGDYTNALEYFRGSLNICEEFSDKSGMAGILSNIGLIYMNQSNYTQALDYYQQSLSIREVISDRKGMAGTFHNIGEIYMNKGDYTKALDYYQKSLEINEDISDKRGIAITLINIGNIRQKQGDFLQAISWCKKGLYTSEEVNILELKKNACDCLYGAYKALGNDNKALEYHERISILLDSLKVEETSMKLRQMEFKKQLLADSLIQEREKLSVIMAHEEEVRKKNMTRNIIILSAFLLLIVAVVIHRRMVYARKVNRAIKNEKDRSEKLLLNILPSEIAEELKEKGKADARKFDKVSILFTDFKEFTQISANLSPEKLVGEINICFEAFDAICEKYGVEKIKTIGDSYMAAGGLPVPSDDSVKNTVLAGLEMADFMINRRKEQEAVGSASFEMRAGIHTGPIVAGIVGAKKFQYDIWGDTVNTASRIETSGEAGKVNIGRFTYDIIKEDPQFKFQSRGKINVKGKGFIEMWFVVKV
mgnify:CR=1 FL=1